MTLRPDIVNLILACMIITLTPRILPLMLARHLVLPKTIEQWLNYIPIAVIAALFAEQVLLVDDNPGITWSAPHLIAGLIALMVANFTHNIGLTIIGGVGTFTLVMMLLKT
ncbi:MAG: AzlD domain-containing protein [Halothece sp.]